MDQNYNNGFNGFDNQNNEPQPVDYSAQYNQYEQPQQVEPQPVDYSSQYNQYEQPQQIEPQQADYSTQYNQYNQYSQPQDYSAQYNQYSQPQQADYSANNTDINNGQPQQYNQPYYNQQYPTYTEPQNNGKMGMGIASLILGIVSTIACCTCCLPPITSIVGIILGALSIKKEDKGKGLAIAGIILSIIGLIITIIWIIYVFANAEVNVNNPYNEFYNEFYKYY